MDKFIIKSVSYIFLMIVFLFLSFILTNDDELIRSDIIIFLSFLSGCMFVISIFFYINYKKLNYRN